MSKKESFIEERTQIEILADPVADQWGLVGNVLDLPWHEVAPNDDQVGCISTQFECHQQWCFHEQLNKGQPAQTFMAITRGIWDKVIGRFRYFLVGQCPRCESVWWAEIDQ